MPPTSYYIVPICLKQPEIIYADKSLLLVNKPEFLLSVPGRAIENKDCLITRIQENFPSATMLHRLDLDTSGILVIPLQKNVHSHISRQFQERRVDKEYTAEVYGIMKKDQGSINFPIARDWENRPKQIICNERGKSALTHWEVIQRYPSLNKTRVKLKPITGRTHQLRIHLSEIGHPILGCDMYAHDEALKMSDRLMLHATYLSLTHPNSTKKIFGYCPPEF